MSFVKGEFQEFRAVIKIHLGDLEKDIGQDDIVEFDGQTARMAGESYNLSKLKAAIAMGWLVPASDTTSVYTPAPSGVSVRPSKAASQEDRGVQMVMDTVDDEEVVVSSHKTAKLGARDGKAVSQDDQGVAIGKLPSATSRTVVSDAASASAETRRLEEGAPPRTRKIQASDEDSAPSRNRPVKTEASKAPSQRAQATEVEDMLPDTTSTPRVRPGIAGEGNFPHLTPAERAVFLRNQRIAEAEVKAAARKAPDEILEAKLAALQAVLPDFEWDLSRSVESRVDDALVNHSQDTAYLNAICAIEEAEVVQQIREAL